MRYSVLLCFTSDAFATAETIPGQMSEATSNIDWELVRLLEAWAVISIDSNNDK